MHLTDEANHPLTLAYLKWTCVAIDQFVQAAAHRDNTSKRENTSMQSMMCVRLFMENEHDTQQLTATRRWSPLCGWNVTAVSVPSGADCYDYVYLPTCVYLMLSAVITLGGGGGGNDCQLWQAVEFKYLNK